MDLGNLSIAGLVFAQFIDNKVFSPFMLITGVILMFICYGVGYNLNK